MLALRVLREDVTVREQLFKSTPIRIGRSEGCDFILIDPSVSRYHATIERDPSGALLLVDSSGTNGLYAGTKRVASETLSGRLRARLGLVEIEIEEVSTAATQPITFEDLQGLDHRRMPLSWVGYIVIALAALVVETMLAPEFWSPWNSQRLVGLVWQTASALVALLFFASIMLGVLKAAGRKVRMTDVLKLFAIFAWLRPLAMGVSFLGYYLLSEGMASLLRSWSAPLLTVAFLAQLATLRRSPPNRTFRGLWAMAILLVLTGVQLTRSYAAHRMGQPEVDHTMQAPLPGLKTGPAVSFEDYGVAVEAAGKRSQDQVK